MVAFKKYLGFILLLLSILVFYSPFLFLFKLPIPSDTIVGLYSPFRDYYAKDYPNGIPYKNFLITDPVRQTYVWKELSIDIYKKFQIPSWNPYEMSGKPLAANLQSGVFYPLNLILLLNPFSISWSIFIMLQSILLAIFTFLFLKNFKLSSYSSILGSLAISFSGFCISWLEWGNVVHTFLWLPLLLLSIDKMFEKGARIRWNFIYSLSLICSLFAGHLQVFFYVVLISLSYFTLRWIESKKDKRILLNFLVSNIISLLITTIQWYPALQFINLSSRSVDQDFSQVHGWFVPWQNLVQFIAPDFLGNPSTLNYFGVWNYAEFVGYVGIITLCFSTASFFKRNSTVIFFAFIILVSMILMLPTGISGFPYILKIPLISTSQPTRLIVLASFSLSVLAAFGFENYVMKEKKQRLNLYAPFLIIGLVLIFLWMSVITNTTFFSETGQNLISKRNLIFPTVIFLMGSVLTVILLKINNLRIRSVLLSVLLLIIFFDLLRFAQKFTPFTSNVYLYPQTQTLKFLKEQEGVFRVASLDRRILAPNIATHYKIQSVEGYDPLYLARYASFIAAMEREKPDISAPYGFNRIITPHNYNSPFFDLLNTEYVLTYGSLPQPRFSLVFEEGDTKVYKNNNSYKRAFFVKDIVKFDNINQLFNNDLRNTAVVDDIGPEDFNVGEADITKYEENSISIKTQNDGEGFLVVTDTYYPTWRAYIDGVNVPIYAADYAFRGIRVPRGSHIITMENSLF